MLQLVLSLAAQLTTVFLGQQLYHAFRALFLECNLDVGRLKMRCKLVPAKVVVNLGSLDFITLQRAKNRR